MNRLLIAAKIIYQPFSKIVTAHSYNFSNLKALQFIKTIVI